jgi:hypothetical protein
MRQPTRSQTGWSKIVPQDQWNTYLAAMEFVRNAGVRFMLGGAFGLACYTGRWRNTKDLDFYIVPGDRDRAIEALTSAGFRDYYEELPYDRTWIYRATRDNYIVDVIWAMANQRAQIAPNWFDHATDVTLKGERLQALPAEELLWCKLYVLQRDRCDWLDLINLLYATGPQLDWDRLFSRVAEDRPVLIGLLSVFSWLAPEVMAGLPAHIRQELPFAPQVRGRKAKELQRRRTELLDTRPWFSAYQPPDKPLQL